MAAAYCSGVLTNLPRSLPRTRRSSGDIFSSYTPSKEQKKQWGKDPAKKLYIQQALYDNFGFKFPNHSLSKKTGKPILFRYDIVDAVAMMVYFLCTFLRVREVTMSVEVPEDVEFKKASKKLFVYPAE